MRYLLDERPDVDLQSNTVDAVQHDAIPQQLYPPIWYRVRVPNFGVPFEFSYIWEDGTLVEIPTFNWCVYLSPDVEVCPSPYCNWAEAELLWLERIVVAKLN